MSTLRLPSDTVPEAVQLPPLALRLHQLFVLAAAGFAFALSWRVSASSILLGVMLGVAVLQAVLQGRSLRLDFDRRVLAASALYFGWLAMSILWSEDKAEAWWEFRKQAVFVLVPLAFAVQPPGVNKGQALYRILIAMTLGVFCAIVFLLVKAYERYVVSGWLEEFFSTQLANPLSAWHTDYARMLAVACVFFLWRVLTLGRRLPWWETGALLLIVVLSTFVQFLLASKLLLVFHVLVLLALLVVHMWRAGYRWAVLALAFVSVSGAAIVTLQVDEIGQRFTRMGQVGGDKITATEFDPCVHQYDELSLRLILWYNATFTIQKSPWIGHGIGDAMNVTGQRMRSINFWPNFHEVNVHNQYLQTMIWGGAVGLTILLLLMAAWARLAWRSRDVLLVASLALLVINALFDAALTMYNVLNVYVFLLTLITWAISRSTLPAASRPSA